MSAKRIKIDATAKKFRGQSRRRARKVINASILIVCEGTKTEPKYFEALAEKQRGVLVYDIDVQVKGIGRGTMSVVEKAIDLKNKNQYDRVWAVFDKDEFSARDFNEAIEKGESNGVEVAWSNEAFELWFLYHFHNVTTGVPRGCYEDKISAAVNASRKYKLKKTYKYRKNAPDNYETVTRYGSQDQAIKYAEKQHLAYKDTCYAEHNPCTTVYRLVRQLSGKDEALNKELVDKVERGL